MSCWNKEMSQKTFFKLNPRQSPVLSSLSQSAADALLATGTRVKVPAGEFLVHEGEQSDSIFFLMSGEVSILKGEHQIDTQGQGGALGEMGVLTNQPRTTSVRCITDIEVLKVGAAEFLQVVDANPDVLRAIIRDMVEKMRGTHQVRIQQLDSIQKATDILSRAVSPEVLNRIFEQLSPEELLEGRLNDAAIMFFDIRGFTSAAEHIPPRDLLRALNDHLAVIIECVARHHGTIVNFIGDAVLAIFNLPVPLKAPASVALNCYLECHRDMNTLLENRRAHGQICFDLGVGINFGTVVSGAIGAESRFSYSVLGDEVNLAARLESLTRHYPVEVILSESFYRQLDAELAGQCMQIDRVQVKGRESPLDLYTLVPFDDHHRRDFEMAFRDYLAGSFTEAANSFAGLNDRVSAYLAERCRYFTTRQVTDWPGYYTWDTK
jgi:class 3 adenylate cyclase